MDINRKTAYLVLVDVESKKAYSNLALNHQMVINKPNAPGFVRELVYGVLENKLTLDYYIDLLVKDGVKSLKTPDHSQNGCLSDRPHGVCSGICRC